MDHGVAVVRDDGVVEHNRPICRQFWNVRRTRNGVPDVSLVGDVDGERQRPLRHGIAAVEDLGHDFVANVEIRHRESPGAPGATRSPMKAGALVGSPAGLPSSATGYSCRMVGS